MSALLPGGAAWKEGEQQSASAVHGAISAISNTREVLSHRTPG